MFYNLIFLLYICLYIYFLFFILITLIIYYNSCRSYSHLYYNFNTSCVLLLADTIIYYIYILYLFIPFNILIFYIDLFIFIHVL